MKTLTTVKLIVIAACAFIVLLSSCKEEETISTEEALKAVQWNISELEITSVVYNQDLFGEIPECNLDDLLDFMEGGDFQVLDNDDECADSQDGITATGSWTLLEDDTKLQINSSYITDILKEAADSEDIPFEFDEESLTFEIEEVSSSILRLAYKTNYNASGFPVTVTVNISFEAVEEI